MRTMREKYHCDNHFYALVNTMVAHIEAAKFTPSEMREAAILASILYAEHHVDTMSLVERETEMLLRDIEKRLDR